MKRRDFLGAAAAAALLPAPAIGQPAAPRVVVVGGGFAGASCARALRKADPRIAVTLVEADATFTACPFSNSVIAGLRDPGAQQFGYAALAADGVALARASAEAVDAHARTVTLADGARLNYDRLVLAPGIDLRWNALPGYDEAAAAHMPHAWRAGEQTLLLRRQLEAMEDGGLVVIAAPANPFRCPPGPYERASMIAMYLKQHKPKSKIVILDANPDIVSKAGLFRKGWAKHYAGMIDYRGAKRVTAVNPKAMTVSIEGLEDVKGDVINVIPPQRAGDIAVKAGLVGADKR